MKKGTFSRAPAEIISQNLLPEAGFTRGKLFSVNDCRHLPPFFLFYHPSFHPFSC